MNEHELTELIAHHEADRVEFTISTKDTDKFSEAVCAFANDLPKHDRPGHLVIGVDDKGRYAGISISDELLRNLGGLRDDGNIQPLPAISVEKIVTAQGEIAVVTVQPALLPPVRYRGGYAFATGHGVPMRRNMRSASSSSVGLPRHGPSTRCPAWKVRATIWRHRCS